MAQNKFERVLVDTLLENPMVARTVIANSVKRPVTQTASTYKRDWLNTPKRTGIKTASKAMTNRITKHTGISAKPDNTNHENNKNKQNINNHDKLNRFKNKTVGVTKEAGRGAVNAVLNNLS